MNFAAKMGEYVQLEIRTTPVLGPILEILLLALNGDVTAQITSEKIRIFKW